MPSNQLDILKKGLVNLQSQTKETKSRLLTRLANHEIITEEEEHWLDHDANLVEEEQVIEELEKASDYEQGLGRLDKIKKKIVAHLSAAAGNMVVSNKRKSKFLSEFCENLLKVQLGPAKKNTVTHKKHTSISIFTHKENATVSQCIEILDWHYANGKNQTKTAKHFNSLYPNLKLTQPLISKWLLNESY